MRGARIEAVAVFSTLLFLVATAGATVFPADGGQGDRAELYTCPQNQILVGFYGRTGAWIDQIGLVCAEFSAPAWKRGSLNRQAAKGGSGGTPQEQYCAGDSAVRQITVTKLFDGNRATARYARSLKFSCFNPRDGSAAGSARFDAPSINYGVVDLTPIQESPHSCPGSEYATGLNIRYGKHVNAIGLICGPVPSASPLAMVPAAVDKLGGPSERLAQGMEANIDRPGSDYDKFHINDENPGRCQSECARQSDRCRAWTYVRPGLQHRYAVCYLKSAAPAPRAGDCCISGVQKKIVGLGRKPTSPAPRFPQDPAEEAPVTKSP